jgi:hypothetical protein
MTELRVVEVGKKPDERIIKLLEGMLERARAGDITALVAMEFSPHGGYSRHGAGKMVFTDIIATLELWKFDLIKKQVDNATTVEDK